MHFQVEHEFAGSCAQVADVLCDPEFHAELDLPDLSRPQVVESSIDGAIRLLRLRYEYVGQIDPVARKLDRRPHAGMGAGAPARYDDLLGEALVLGRAGRGPAERRRRGRDRGRRRTAAVPATHRRRSPRRVPLVGGNRRAAHRARARPPSRRRGRRAEQGAHRPQLNPATPTRRRSALRAPAGRWCHVRRRVGERAVPPADVVPAAQLVADLWEDAHAPEATGLVEPDAGFVRQRDPGVGTDVASGDELVEETR